MSKINAIVKSIKIFGKSIKTTVQIHSPKILLIGGLAAIGAGTIWACINTAKKIEDISDLHSENIEDIIEDEKKNDEQKASSILKEKGRFIFDIVKVYIGPIGLIALGATSICASHHILNMRYLKTCAALQSITEAFAQYRNRVSSAEGTEKDIEYALSTAKDTKEEMLRKVSTESIVRIFSEDSSDCWKPRTDYNYAFLTGQEQAARRELKRRGHLFLNDVLSMLGMHECEAGCYIGWVNAFGDEVDFGIMDLRNLSNLGTTDYKSEAWVLNFNCVHVVPAYLETEELSQPYQNAVREYKRIINGGD